MSKQSTRVREIIAEYRGRCNVVGEYLALKELAIALARSEAPATSTQADDMREEHDRFCSCDACRDDRELVDAERRADARREKA